MRLKQVKPLLSSTIQRFIKAQEGVYSVMMGVVGVALMLVVAFAVDGSGAILDQARLSDSLEQASLTLTAENNTHRQDEFALRGKSTQLTQQLKTGRNKEIVENYVKAYLPQTQSWEPHTIECTQEKTSLTSEKVVCRVSGTVARQAWFPWLFDTASSSSQATPHQPGVIRVSNTAVAEKQKASPPMDIMVVADFSGSMNYPLEGREIKINVLRSVLKNLVDNVLFKDPNNLNRIGLTTFSLGSPPPNTVRQCALPYQFYPGTDLRLLQYAFSHLQSNNILKNFVPNINIPATIDAIKYFDGSDKAYGLRFALRLINYTYGVGSTCVGYSREKVAFIPTTQYWFDTKSYNQFKGLLDNIYAEGGTLSSSGVLVGANLMMDASKFRTPKDYGNNTQRVMIILSDGKDEFLTDKEYYNEHREWRYNLESQYRNLMPRLIHQGLCRAILSKFDSVQDKNYPIQRSKLVFIAFGYDPSESNERAWKECVGEKNFFVAKQESELLEAFKRAIIAEEIGHSVAP